MKRICIKDICKDRCFFIPKNEPGSFLHLKINPLRKMKGKEN